MSRNLTDINKTILLLENMKKDFKKQKPLFQLYKTTDWLHKPQNYQLLEDLYNVPTALDFQKQVLTEILPEMFSELHVKPEPVVRLNIEVINGHHFYIAEFSYHEHPFLLIDFFHNLKVTEINSNIDKYNKQISILRKYAEEHKRILQTLIVSDTDPDRMYDKGNLSTWEYFRIKLHKRNTIELKKESEIEEHENAINLINQQIMELQTSLKIEQDKEIAERDTARQIQTFCERIRKKFTPISTKDTEKDSEIDPYLTSKYNNIPVNISVIPSDAMQVSGDNLEIKDGKPAMTLGDFYTGKVKIEGIPESENNTGKPDVNSPLNKKQGFSGAVDLDADN